MLQKLQLKQLNGGLNIINLLLLRNIKYTTFFPFNFILTKCKKKKKKKRKIKTRQQLQQLQQQLQH
jgi:uncharacterized membrane protein